MFCRYYRGPIVELTILLQIWYIMTVFVVSLFLSSSLNCSFHLITFVWTILSPWLNLWMLYLWPHIHFLHLGSVSLMKLQAFAPVYWESEANAIFDNVFTYKLVHIFMLTPFKVRSQRIGLFSYFMYSNV